MSNKLHIIVHTINGTVTNTYNSWHEDLVVNMIPNDVIYKSDIKDLIHYGSAKSHIGNQKHCFYYHCFNTI